MHFPAQEIADLRFFDRLPTNATPSANFFGSQRAFLHRIASHARAIKRAGSSLEKSRKYGMHWKHCEFLPIPTCRDSSFRRPVERSLAASAEHLPLT
jgi:hypothetical protein